jgi:large subunit ribosomal protein L24
MQALKPTAKPSKQRRMLYQAPDHIRQKLFAAPLSSNLQASHGIKSLPVRSGDTVRIMRGDHKGFEGKITRIDRGNYRIYVEGLTREKVDGTAIFVPVHPSKVTITGLTLDDKWRKKILERKKQARKKVKKVAVKPAEEIVKPEEKMAKEKAVEKKAVPKKKLEAKKPRARKRTVAKKPVEEKTEKEKEKIEPEQKPKTKRQRVTRRPAKKSGGA